MSGRLPLTFRERIRISMKIHADFECGNIRFLREEGQDIYLQNEMRGTARTSQYYWAFCVEGAAGRTLTFHLNEEWVGPLGAAVSHDLIDWHWTESRDDGGTFTYTFGENEDRVYFAHDLVYTPTRLFTVLGELGIRTETFCLTNKGREVPCFRIGEGKRNMVLASRHHSCESSGNYVLEGMIREYLSAPIPDTSLLVVPMVDYDGVCEGEQGKGRAPYDHNRDYVTDCIYPETGAIMAYAKDRKIPYAFDFHAPSHCVGRSNRVFVVRKFPALTERFDTFGRLLEKYSGGDAMGYDMAYDVAPNSGWNKDETPTFSTFFNVRPECELALTLEVTHFGREEDRVTAEKLLGTGRAFCRAVAQFMQGK